MKAALIISDKNCCCNLSLTLKNSFLYFLLTSKYNRQKVKTKFQESEQQQHLPAETFPDSELVTRATWSTPIRSASSVVSE